MCFKRLVSPRRTCAMPPWEQGCAKFPAPSPVWALLYHINSPCISSELNTLCVVGPKWIIWVVYHVFRWRFWSLRAQERGFFCLRVTWAWQQCWPSLQSHSTSRSAVLYFNTFKFGWSSVTFWYYKGKDRIIVDFSLGVIGVCVLDAILQHGPHIHLHYVLLNWARYIHTFSTVPLCIWEVCLWLSDLYVNSLFHSGGNSSTAWRDIHTVL